MSDDELSELRKLMRALLSPLLYTLDGHEPKPCADATAWATWIAESEQRVVALSRIDESEVSTVFFGVDASMRRDRPLLFETMVFGGPLDRKQWRYATWDEAEKHHAAIVEELRQKLQ